MTAKSLLKEGYIYGNGLGRSGQGSLFPLHIVENKNRYGLGYKPTKEDKKILLEEKRERALAHIQGREPRMGRIHICDIKESFHSVGWINTRQISVIEEQQDVANSDSVWPCPPNVQLNN